MILFRISAVPLQSGHRVGQIEVTQVLFMIKQRRFSYFNFIGSQRIGKSKADHETYRQVTS